MKTTTIEEIKDTEQSSADDIIKKIKVKITKLYDAKKGGDGDKQWELQNGEVMDPTGKIAIVFSKCSQPKSAIGKEITIEAFHGDKGWSGLYVDDNEYDKKDGEHVKERRIKVTPTANIIYDEEVSGSSKTQSKGETRTEYLVDKGNRTAREQFNDIVAMYKECYNVSLNMDTELAKNPQAIVAATATLFIEMNKQNLSFDFRNRFADKPKPKEETRKEKKEEEPAEERAKGWWKDVEIPKGVDKGVKLGEAEAARIEEFYHAYKTSEKGFSSPFGKAIQAAWDDIKDELP